MKQLISNWAAGALFGLGLVLAGMTQPGKVVGFLDITGDWDPSLAMVMGGAMTVYAIAFRLITRREQPLMAARFGIPTRRDLTPQLIIGAVLFGMGWGLGGFCPGPALVSVGAMARNAFIFVPAMLGGMVLHKVYDDAMSRRKVAAAAAQAPAEAAVEHA